MPREMTEPQRSLFVSELGDTLRANYPTITDVFLRTELDSQLAGNSPKGFMDMVIKSNLDHYFFCEEGPNG